LGVIDIPGNITKPAKSHQSIFLDFLGYRALPSQQLEYYFKVKAIPKDQFYFFEHFVNEKDKQFTSKPWRTGSANSRNWEINSTLTIKTWHFLEPGNYQFFIGFADFDNPERRLEFSNSLDSRIIVGSIILDDLKEKSLASPLNSKKQKQELLTNLQETDFPVYLKSGSAIAWSQTNRSIKNRAIVISIPKTGTYLVGELLKNLGYIFAGIHVNLNSLDDFRNATTMLPSEQVKRFVPLSDTVRLILDGQYIVGHVKYEKESKVLLSRYKKIFAYRDLRHAIVSRLRSDLKVYAEKPSIKKVSPIGDRKQQLVEYLNYEGKSIFSQITDVIGWYKEDDVLKVKFEELLGDFGKENQLECVKRVASHLSLEVKDPEKILAEAIGKETLPYSGSRTNIEDYWSNKAEEIFVKSGLDKINKQLGY